MKVSAFLQANGFTYSQAIHAIDTGLVDIIWAGTTSPSRYFKDIDIGYGDTVRVTHKGAIKNYHYKASQGSPAGGRPGRNSQPFWLILIPVGFGFIISRIFIDVYPGPQWRAEDLAKKQKAEIERVKQEQESRAELIRLEKEQAERVAEQQRRKAEKEAEDQMRQNIPMGVSTPVKSDRKVTVSDARLYNFISANNQFAPRVTADGGKLLVVYMTIENTGKSSGDMAWSSFTVEDEGGNKYYEVSGESFAISMWRDELGLGDSGDQLFPGQAKLIAKVFRIRDGAAGLKLATGGYKFLLYN